MNQLKFRLWVEGNAVNFQVLAMPESLRGKGNLFTAGNGVEIYSRDGGPLVLCTKAALDLGTYNGCGDTGVCDSIPEAHRAFANYLEALQEFAASYKLTEQAEPEPTDDAHTYTLTFTA